MAKFNAVWGIDIGQCALKALRVRPGDDPNRITADAFDYIEYPQILSQPEANPVELVREALEQFLSRNSVRGDRVVISVSGQSGLARFIKLPPIEAKKIPDIIKYEARQQIPFALDDVVWDYQRMPGGSEEDGILLESEVGLFAMKRDQVFRALRPFEEAGIEVDMIQLTPLAIYNYTVFDQMVDLPPADEYDPDNPPESVVVLSLGTDTTDLVITNGYRVWQRSVPLGGSHFTKALSKELRLTFAKAEHLKRNAMQAEDRGAVFQAMRPVFNDLLTEVQRSIGFFSNIGTSGAIGRVVALGNATKLPGLQKYLAQNLGYPVVEVESYRGLSGSGVVAAPVFKENLLSFAVCYGLALQGLGRSKLSTNLLPREILTDRLIRDKKPWGVGVAAALMLAFTLSILGYWRAWHSVFPANFAVALDQAAKVENEAKGYTDAYAEKETTFKQFDQMGKNIIGNVEGRLMWIEVLKALDACLPAGAMLDGQDPPSDPTDRRQTGADIAMREELHITDMDCEHRADLATWYQSVQGSIKEEQAAAGAGAQPGPAAPGAAPPGPPGASAAPAGLPAPGAVPPGPPVGAMPPGPPAAGGPPGAATEGPTGEGWVIQLKGYHYHNSLEPGEEEGAQYLVATLLKDLQSGTVELPVVQTGGKTVMKRVPISELGVSCPVIIRDPKIVDDVREDPTLENDQRVQDRRVHLRKYEFTVQFCWQ
ncbi:MAG TPA: type IV pilus assembly protein PilM, partial [Pirellulales bacterium]